ncbi:Uncharacterised protein r2_g3914 [Pycnogonum litorale]
MLDVVICQYGLPRFILSDNGSQFFSSLFKSLCQLMEVKRINTSVNHPQTNLTERINKILGVKISIYVGNNHLDWYKNLPYFRFAINSTYQHTTGFTPFLLNFGREPRLPQNPFSVDPVEELELMDNNKYVKHQMELLNIAWDTAREHVIEQQERQKHYYDQKRRDLEYPDGTLVWLQTQLRSNKSAFFMKKLAPKWCGPFKIVQHRGVNYYLETSNGEIKGKYHIEQLKLYHSNNPEEDLTSDLESDNDVSQCSSEQCDVDLIRWVCCDKCDLWYHQACVNAPPDVANQEWLCPKCV